MKSQIKTNKINVDTVKEILVKLKKLNSKIILKYYTAILDNKIQTLGNLIIPVTYDNNNGSVIAIPSQDEIDEYGN